MDWKLQTELKEQCFETFSPSYKVFLTYAPVAFGMLSLAYVQFAWNRQKH